MNTFFYSGKFLRTEIKILVLSYYRSINTKIYRLLTSLRRVKIYWFTLVFPGAIHNNRHNQILVRNQFAIWME